HTSSCRFPYTTRFRSCDPEFEPATRKHINHRGVLRGTHRILVRQGHHGGAQTYPFGGLSGSTQKWPRGRQPALSCIEVVLGDPRGGKPGTFCLQNLFKGPAITLCCGALIEEPGKKSYAWHGVVLYVS